MPDLKNAEIFATGLWNKRQFTTDDLDGIVRSFEFFNLSGRIPLKLGHNTDQPLTDGQPALGWVERIWREGNKLLADFRDVPGVVYDAMRKGLYKFVSVELLRDVTADTRVVPLVLDAVALLGADLPAVGTLKDLQVLTLSRLRGEGRLNFTQAFTSGDYKAMADEDTKINEELAALRKQNEKLANDVAMERARSAAESEKYSRLQDETRAKEVTAKRKEIMELLETAVRSKRMLAAARERFVRQFQIETSDDSVIRMPISDVESYIRDNPNPFLKASAVTASGNPDEIPTGGLPDKELMARSRKLCIERGKNPDEWEHLKSAGMEIMRADPALAERYRALPDDHADGKYSA